MFGVYSGLGRASCARLYPRHQRLVPIISSPTFTAAWAGRGSGALQLKVKWMRVVRSRVLSLSQLVIRNVREHIHHSVTSLRRVRNCHVNRILNSFCPLSDFSLATQKEIRIYLEEQQTFNTTAGVIRQGEVSRPASGAQLPRANQQQRWIPTSARRDELPQEKEQIQNDAVFRRVRGILNKVGVKLFSAQDKRILIYINLLDYT